MGSALDVSAGIVGYLTLFASMGLAFVFVNLLIGRFLRPHNPHAEKLEIYECGEPSIGSSFVQFDLRFYVVALVFIIFDVEVAFLFPWATVFGKVTNLRNDPLPIVAVSGSEGRLTEGAAGVYRELGDTSAVAGAVVARSEQELRRGIVTTNPETGRAELVFAGLEQMVQFTVVAVSFFFVVLLIGFAYEWRTGALDWVRALGTTARPPTARTVTLKAGGRGSVLSN
jgi:NADH-quinone oxidoreductase subunit A